MFTRYISWHLDTACTIHPRISVSNTDQTQYSLVLIKIAIHPSLDEPGSKAMNLLGCSLLALILLPNCKTATSLWKMKIKRIPKGKSTVSTANASDSIIPLLFFCISFNQAMAICQGQCPRLEFSEELRLYLESLLLNTHLLHLQRRKQFIHKCPYFLFLTTKC